MPEPPAPGDPPRRRAPAPPGSAEEALQRIEERLDRASEAAERLIAEAAAEAARGGGGGGVGGGGGGGDPTTPPSGWQIPGDATAPPDLDPFVSLVQALRDLVPPELQRRLIAALRELLLALRALIDWYLERLERRRDHAVEVEDIPIF
jgi:hypothetical protein